MDYLDINAVDKENEVQNLNDLLDTYIQKDLDQQNQIAELEQTVYKLQHQVADNEKELIKKDLLNILGEEAHDLMGLDDIVDYILEKGNK